MTAPRTALILGATGNAGHATALALLRRGWRIRALHRTPARAAPALPGAEWVAGDALASRDVIAAARGASVIVHAVNPPGYRNWETLVLPMLEATLAAARASGARIVLPGTVYNYAPEVGPRVAEHAPQTPRTSKGRIRVAMEARLAASGLPALVLRAGDFFGPRAGSTWFGQAMVKAGAPLRSVTYPGRPEVGHAWAYLPDFAETLARLLDHPGLGSGFETFHFGGHWVGRGLAMAEAVAEAAGNPGLPIRRFPWPAVRLLAPVVPMFRGLIEMRWLWETPLQLDNRRLVALLGEEPHTPLPEALRTTLAGLGCLPRDAAAEGAPQRTARCTSKGCPPRQGRRRGG